MTISYKWLKEYINTDLQPEKLADILTDIGLEVEKIHRIESVPGGLAGVVVGRVLTCEKHADADRLRVTTVDTGADQPLQIVCGAPNVAAGQSVLVATVGATLYPTGSEEPLKIKRSKIRGIESLGMICAGDELGIDGDHSGIMVLEDSPAPGTQAGEYLNIQEDYAIEIGLTPNRIDAASHFGVARDLHAKLRTDGKDTHLSLPPVDSFGQDCDGAAVLPEVCDTAGAPRYAGITLDNITVGPSPDWMQERLRAIGINPKNNVVDITNYILHETGQPLHAFDADKISGERIVVRNCDEGTTFTLLDESEIKLSADDLMICDAEKALCLAGVMGGRDSGVSESTKRIFIESAYFNPTRVRRSARRHGLSTDSSFRFERGADPNMVIFALKRAALLMKELAGGRIVSPITDLYPTPVEHFRIEASYGRLNKLIGKDIPAHTVKEIVSALDINIVEETGDGLLLDVPPFRVDVRREADLAEEIMRIYGYNNIEIPERVTAAIPFGQDNSLDKLVIKLSDYLTAGGFNETMNNSLSGEAYYEGLQSYSSAELVRMLNPLSSEMNVMRQTHLFGALETVIANSNRKNPDLKLYESGNIYRLGDKDATGVDKRYQERPILSLTVTGQRHAQSWNDKSRPVDFFYLKGVIEKMFAWLGLPCDGLNAMPLGMGDLYSEGIMLTANDKQVVRIGKVAAATLQKFDIDAEVYFAEIELAQLIKLVSRKRISVSELSRFPQVRRDLALLVDSGVQFNDLREAALSAERKFLKAIALFDVYEGKNLPQGKKSYALSFILEDREATMTDQRIDRIMSNILNRLTEKCGVQLRDK